MYLTDEYISKIIKNVLQENTFLKTGKQGPALGQGMQGMSNTQPQEQIPLSNDNMDVMNMENVPSEEEMPNQNQSSDNSESEFDTNFDAGVDANEDEDPKKYLQQLTGKLSQTLSKYLNENGADNELCKYISKMIIKQAVKGLDDASKKEIIKTINTTESEEEIPSDSDTENTNDELDDTELPMDDSEDAEPIQEMMIFKKGDFKHIYESLQNNTFNYNDDEKQAERTFVKANNTVKKGPFSSKKFNKK